MWYSDGTTKYGEESSFITIEEGRAVSKSPHYKFGYFLSISQQAVSADIIQIQLWETSP
jgi:hypothetical protein